jgi:hypothetical protein
MSIRVWLGCLLLLIGSAVQAEAVSYQRDIQPIFTAKCVACHACYDSPCQLNLGSGEGASRGGHKLPVYNGVRVKAQQPTRLFLDADGDAAWRRKGFHSVLKAEGNQAALMARMLELGRSQPLVPNAKLPAGLDISIDRENSCPLAGEFDSYARKNAHGGKPFAVTGLGDEEYATIQRWLEQGAPVEHRQLSPTPAEALQIAEWEGLLNTPGARGNLVGRWL